MLKKCFVHFQFPLNLMFSTYPMALILLLWGGSLKQSILLLLLLCQILAYQSVGLAHPCITAALDSMYMFCHLHSVSVKEKALFVIPKALIMCVSEVRKVPERQRTHRLNSSFTRSQGAAWGEKSGRFWGWKTYQSQEADPVLRWELKLWYKVWSLESDCFRNEFHPLRFVVCQRDETARQRQIGEAFEFCVLPVCVCLCVYVDIHVLLLYQEK